MTCIANFAVRKYPIILCFAPSAEKNLIIMEVRMTIKTHLIVLQVASKKPLATHSPNATGEQYEI